MERSSSDDYVIRSTGNRDKDQAYVLLVTSCIDDNRHGQRPGSDERVMLEVRRSDNIRRLYDQLVWRNGIRPVKEWISTRLVGDITTPHTLQQSICST